MLYLRRVQGSLLCTFCLLFVSVCGTAMILHLLIYIQINLRKTSPLLYVNLKLSFDTAFLLRGQCGESSCLEEAGNLRPDLSTRSSSFPGNFFGFVQYSSRHLLGKG